MSVQKQNFVTQVAIQSNISLGNTAGTLTKPGSIAEYAANAAGNFGKIAEIGMHAAALAEKSQPSSDPSQNSGPSFARSAIGAAVVMAAGPLAPLAAAAVGVAMAIGEAAHFGMGHAAVNGVKGELTMAASAATFDNKGEMTSYKAACDDITTDVKSGKSLASVTMGAPAAPLRGAHNVGAIVGEVADKYDPEQIQKDVRAMLEREQKNYGWAVNKLDMMVGGLDPAISKDLGVKETMAELKMDKKPLKALNVGMGAPAAFGMG